MACILVQAFFMSAYTYNLNIGIRVPPCIGLMAIQHLELNVISDGTGTDTFFIVMLQTQFHSAAASLSSSATSAHETGKLLSWETIRKFYDRLPCGIAPCASARDAKMYTAALLAVISAILPPLLIPAAYIFIYRAAKEGGAK